MSSQPEMCCGQTMKIRPIVDEYGLLYNYECDVCRDGFTRNPGEIEVDLIEEFRKVSEKT